MPNLLLRGATHKRIRYSKTNNMPIIWSTLEIKLDSKEPSLNSEPITKKAIEIIIKKADKLLKLEDNYLSLLEEKEELTS